MYGQYSALVEIPSALLSFLFAQLFSSILPFALSFAAGAMLYIVSGELIPESNQLYHGRMTAIGNIIGFLIGMFAMNLNI